MRSAQSGPYFKVLTEEIYSPLRVYAGVCATRRSEATAAWSAGPTAFAAALTRTSGTDEHEHLVNGITEVIFEEERGRRKPARMRSVHVFRSVEAARRFRNEFRRNAIGIYEVDHDGEFVHNSFMEWLNATLIDSSGDLLGQIAEIRQNARRYWNSEPPLGAGAGAYTETLLSPNVRVVRLVER